MRLIIPWLCFDNIIEEGIIHSISIENPLDFRRVIGAVWEKDQGRDGDIILSEKETILGFKDHILCIFNLIDLNANNRRILTRLYKELNENAQDVLAEEFSLLQGTMLSYIEKLTETVPYDLSYNYELDISDLLKIYDVKLNQLPESYNDQLIDYLRAFSRICNIKTVICVNIKNYMTEKEIIGLQEFIRYEKIRLINIENLYSYKVYDEKAWIIDKDRSIIDLN